MYERLFIQFNTVHMCDPNNQKYIDLHMRHFNNEVIACSDREIHKGKI